MPDTDPATNGPDGRGGPHVFVDVIEAPTLSASDRHHLERVLRLRAGDPLTVSDGRGWWRACRYGVPLTPVDEPQVVPAPTPELTVAFAPVKGDRPEWVVQKLTELGIDRILVLETDRSVVRWAGERATRQVERLVRVAREASMQSRRCHLPVIEGVSSVAAVAETHPDAVRADRGGKPLSSGVHTVMVGPEGGWTDEERALVRRAVGLGDHVLRAETAAVTAGALMTAVRGGWAGAVPRDRPV